MCNECNPTLTSVTRSIYPYPNIYVEKHRTGVLQLVFSEDLGYPTWFFKLINGYLKTDNQKINFLRKH